MIYYNRDSNKTLYNGLSALREPHSEPLPYSSVVMVLFYGYLSERRYAYLIFNYYELLGLRYDASKDQILVSYRQKIDCSKSNLMKQRYDTAYFNLIDDERRFKYDQSIGLYRYRKHGNLFKTSVILARLLLTVTDTVMTFYWCFLLVVTLYACAELYMRTGSIDLSLLWKMYFDEIYILALIALIDLVGHFYVRRANRYLKHILKRKMNFNEYVKYMSQHK